MRIISKLNLYLFVISAIFIFGLVLRIVQLSNVPPGFNADEAALGYNAYSLINTGKDEWGAVFPLVFKSFADYKPGLYVYLDIPFVWVFGLNELSVRLPSIILGSLSIILIYLLSDQLFKKKSVALSSSFLLAISPWHLQYSRGAWETNAATFFILLGVWLFVQGYKNWKWVTLASLSFAAAVYTYQSTRLVAPLIMVLITVFYWKSLAIKKNLFALIFTVIFFVPLIFIMFDSPFLARFQGISIFSDTGPVNLINQERGEDLDPNSLSAKFYHNKIIVYSNNFLSHYLDHFNPDFLFINGDPLKRNKVPGMGQFYIFEIITIIIGLYIILKNKFKFKDVKIVFIWLFVSPVAAALTYQTPHALRAENMMIPLTLISGLGLGVILERFWLIKNLIRYFFLSIVFLPIILFFTLYLHQYYVHLPKEYALEWQYGFSEMLSYVLANQDKYQKVLITDRYDQPYILLLFYSKYDPLKYQQTPKKEGDNKYGFTTITNFDKYEFRPISKEDIQSGKNTLFVGTGEEINQGNVLKTINFPDGSPAFAIVGT